MLRKTTETGMRVPVRPWAATGSCAIDVLVRWALVDQKAGNAVAGLSELEAGAAGLTWVRQTMTAAVQEIAALGCRVDVCGGSRDIVHPAAEAVAAAVAVHPDAGLIRRCALAGEPGGWAAPARWLSPERWEIEGERAMWCWGERRNVGAHCPLVSNASEDTIAAGRAEWTRWWDALVDVMWALEGRAMGFALKGPSVRREPWVKGEV